MRTLGILLLFSCIAFADDAAPRLSSKGKGTLEEGIRGGVEFLVKNQNKNGSFGKTSNQRPYQLWCEVPGGHQAFQVVFPVGVLIDAKFIQISPGV